MTLTTTPASTRSEPSDERQSPSTDVVVSRRSLWATMVSFGGAQGVIAASSLVRIPLLAGVLGQARLRLNFVIRSPAPFLLAIAGGVRSASRNLVAQQRGAAAGRTISMT